MAPNDGLTNGWIALLAAPFVGSFLGVLIRRLPEGNAWAWSRSRCETCRRVLPPQEMLPLVSFAVLRGRCAGCGAAIGWFHPAVECAAVLVAAGAIWATPEDAALIWAGCGLGWTLLALAWIDARAWRLPDALTLPLVLAGLAQAALLAPEAATDRALAAAFGYLSFRLLGLAYRRLRGREGLGMGDAKLLAAGGAWLGTAALPWVVAGAGVLGLAAAGCAALAGARIGGATRLPFGPFLAAAIWSVWLIA